MKTRATNSTGPYIVLGSLENTGNLTWEISFVSEVDDTELLLAAAESLDKDKAADVLVDVTTAEDNVIAAAELLLAEEEPAAESLGRGKATDVSMTEAECNISAAAEEEVSSTEEFLAEKLVDVEVVRGVAQEDDISVETSLKFPAVGVNAGAPLTAIITFLFLLVCILKQYYFLPRWFFQLYENDKQIHVRN